MTVVKHLDDASLKAALRLSRQVSDGSRVIEAAVRRIGDERLKPCAMRCTPTSIPHDPLVVADLQRIAAVHQR